ncbi:MAG: HAD-IIA family hydrolase [Clostridium sp.]|nr:HAD-IIA family hydrolase [Clostridium sp.]
MPNLKTIPAVNQDNEHIIDNIRCFALDMDGTVYLGEQWIAGAKEFLAGIEASGRSYVFLTNNSSKNPAVYVEKLRRMGWDVTEEKIITSGQATIFYLQKHFAGKKVFLLGNPLLQEEFAQAGITLDDTAPDVVVTAFDTSLTYAKMCKVCDFVRAGLPYLATHPDYNCPTETGFIPDAGAIHAFIHASACRYPDRIIGKPNSDIVDYLTQRVQIKREQIAMVGDRLYTDIAAGVNNGLKSILVLSGEATLEEAAASDITPHLIFHSVRDMIPLL